MNSVPRDFVFNRFEARQGMTWLGQAYAMFSQQRLLWVVRGHSCGLTPWAALA